MFMSSSKTAIWKRSQARSSFSMMFVEGWDELGTVDLDKGILDEGVLDGVDSIEVDESISTIWMEGWDWGGLDLTTLDEPCFTLLSRWLGSPSKSMFFSNNFLLSPAVGRTCVWTSGDFPHPQLLSLCFLSLLTFLKWDSKQIRNV